MKRRFVYTDERSLCDFQGTLIKVALARLLYLLCNI